MYVKDKVFSPKHMLKYCALFTHKTAEKTHY